MKRLLVLSAIASAPKSDAAILSASEPLADNTRITMRRYLLTCELVENYDIAAKRLKLLPHRIMLRIPIQWDEEENQMDDPRNYVEAFKTLSEVSDIMIEFVDSDAMKHLSPDSFEAHVNNCLRVLKPYCAAAEAGNEVNGDWLGDHTTEKVVRALSACQNAQLPAAVTYYLSADNERQMFEWIDQHPLKSDYALISHYPNTTPGVKIKPIDIFREFAKRFPAPALVGWGEYGTQDGDGNNSAGLDERAALIREIEQNDWQMIEPAVANYAGFGGYWDWGTDKELDKEFKEVWK
jgi:hypothetical protein